MVIIDTCVWSLFLRRRALHREPVVDLLRELIGSGRAVVPGIVKQELLSGVKAQSQFNRLLDRLRGFPDLPATGEDHVTAARFNNTCRGHGVQGSFIDFLICALAVNRGYSVLTVDRDFERYAEVLPLKFIV